MLRAVPVRPFSKTYSVLEDDREMARISIGWFTDRGTAAVDGRTMRLDRERLYSGAFRLELDGVVLAQAYKPNIFRNRFELELGKSRITLEREGLLGRSFVARRGKDVVGRVESESVFARRARIDLPDDWPLSLKLFVFWLVLIIWKRMRNN